MKTTCTCTVFARSGKLHNHDCPKYQAYERTSTRKASKKERIKELLEKLRTPEPTPPIDEELMELLGVKTDTKDE